MPWLWHRCPALNIFLYGIWDFKEGSNVIFCEVWNNYLNIQLSFYLKTFASLFIVSWLFWILFYRHIYCFFNDIDFTSNEKFKYMKKKAWHLTILYYLYQLLNNKNQILYSAIWNYSIVCNIFLQFLFMHAAFKIFVLLLFLVLLCYFCISDIVLLVWDKMNNTT